MDTGGFAIGDLVFAKMRGYPPWPALITNPIQELKKPSRGTGLCVFFFGTRNYSWIGIDKLQPYQENVPNCKKGTRNHKFVAALKEIKEYKENCENLTHKHTPQGNKISLSSAMKEENSSSESAISTDNKGSQTTVIEEDSPPEITMSKGIGDVGREIKQEPPFDIPTNFDESKSRGDIGIQIKEEPALDIPFEETNTTFNDTLPCEAASRNVDTCPFRTTPLGDSNSSYECNSCSNCRAIINRLLTSKLVKAEGWMKQTKKHEKLRKCPSCDYKTGNSIRLKNHIMAKHTHEKPRKCPYCNYATVECRNLKNHLRAKHTGEKTHKCPYCTYAAVQSINLKNHIWAKHSVVKPKACPHCSYNTVEYTNLKNHIIAKHTRERPNKCPHCPFACVQFSGLKAHFKSKHPNLSLSLV